MTRRSPYPCCPEEDDRYTAHLAPGFVPTYQRGTHHDDEEWDRRADDEPEDPSPEANALALSMAMAELDAIDPAMRRDSREE